MNTSSTHTLFQASWRRTRWMLAALGMLLPYAAQLGNEHGIQAYVNAGWQGNAFALAMGAVLWLPLLGLTWLYRFPHSILWPAALGLGFAFWAHISIDLAADAQAGLAVVLIPLLSLVPMAIGGLIGWGVDMRQRRKEALKDI